MRAATFFAFFLAMFAMFCSTASASAFDVEKRGVSPIIPSAAFNATVDLLVKEQASIVVKAFADVCTDTDLSAALSSDLKVHITGLVNVDFDIGSKLSAALKTSIKAAVQAEVSADIKSEFTANLNVNIGAIIAKRCPNLDAACIKVQAKNIASDTSKLTVKLASKVKCAIEANLSARIKAAVDVQVKKFSVDLLLVKISVAGDVDVSTALALKFKAAVGLSASACADIEAKEASQIKAISSA